MRPAVEIFLVDAFTKTIYRGNPAAVCLLPQGVDQGLFTEDWMQSVAREMNLSETAFLVKPSPGLTAEGLYYSFTVIELPKVLSFFLILAVHLSLFQCF